MPEWLLKMLGLFKRHKDYFDASKPLERWTTPKTLLIALDASAEAHRGNLTIALGRWLVTLKQCGITPTILATGTPASQADVWITLGNSGIQQGSNGYTHTDVTAGIISHATITLDTTLFGAARHNDIAAQNVICHELGHSFGISYHSSENDDTMYSPVSVNYVSSADRSTLKKVYSVV